VTLLIGPMAGGAAAEGKQIASTVSVALTMTFSLIAAHIAFARIEPMLSSKQLADTMMAKGSPIYDTLFTCESLRDRAVIFYTHEVFCWAAGGYGVAALRDSMGEGSTLPVGSCYRELRRDIFLDDDPKLCGEWGQWREEVDFAEGSGRDKWKHALGGRLISVQDDCGQDSVDGQADAVKHGPIHPSEQGTKGNRNHFNGGV